MAQDKTGWIVVCGLCSTGITSISATNHIGHNHIGHIEDHIGHRQSRYRPQVDISHKRLVKILPLLLNERNFLIRVLYKDCY